MIIPHSSLPREVLEQLIEEIVTRDGTDYGLVERTTESKVQAVFKALQSGRFKLLWNLETESASLISAEMARQFEAEKLDSDGAT